MEPAGFSSADGVYTFRCICAHMHGEDGGLLTESSWGRLSPLVTFLVSQQTWQPRRVRGKWRALRTHAGASTEWQMAPSRSGRRHDGAGRGASELRHGQRIMAERGRKRCLVTVWKPSRHCRHSTLVRLSALLNRVCHLPGGDSTGLQVALVEKMLTQAELILG